ncbi:MAG TPA: MFS transporter [Candidatus Paceibacterota bacterium]|nr:MFS transporter [Candidatus Paceibacterota bacterium]
MKKDRDVWYIGLLSFFGGISQDMFAPVLPIYLTTILGFDKTLVGIAEGLVTAGWNVFRVVAGYLSDRLKRQKPLIFIGYFLSMLARPLLAAFSAVAPVFTLRFLDGAGKGLKDPPKDVLIAGTSPEAVRGRSFGVARMLDTLGSVAGPLLLALLLYLFRASSSVYHIILIVSAVPLFVTLSILTARVREIPRSVVRAQSVHDQRRPLPLSFYVFLAVVVVFTLGNSSDAFLILRARNLGTTLIEVPLVIALFNLIYALGAVPFGSLSDRIGRIPTLAIGWLAYALTYLGFALAAGAFIVWPLYILYGIYYAMSEGVARAFLADIVEFGHRGRAFGIYGMTVGLTTLPASFLAGFLWDRYGPRVPFFFGAGLAALAVLCLVLTSKFRKR